MIAAGIDIGSNTFRLLLARVEQDRMTSLVKELVSVRLGRGLEENGVLSPEAMEKSLEALALFRKIIERYKPVVMRACGTAALRKAGNREEFLARAAKALGMDIEIISGAEEASLSLAGALNAMQVPGGEPVLLADVGGGSTELVFLQARDKSGADKKIVSLPVGAVGLTETFLHLSLPSAFEIDKLTSKIREVLSPALEKTVGVVQPLSLMIVGTGGTATTLAALDLGLAHYDESRVQGYRLSASGLEELWNRLLTLPLVERQKLSGLEPGRADIILAGTRIYQVLLDLLAAQQMIVSDAGLLEGIVLSRIMPAQGQPNKTG